MFDTVDLFVPDVQFETQAAYLRLPRHVRQRLKEAGKPLLATSDMKPARMQVPGATAFPCGCWRKSAGVGQPASSAAASWSTGQPKSWSTHLRLSRCEVVVAPCSLLAQACLSGTACTLRATRC